MKTLVTGHRLHKLECYDIPWIKRAIENVFDATFLNTTSYGLSGMASGVDLWFCAELRFRNIPYAACIPFEEQEKTMDDHSKFVRDAHIEKASQILNIRNSAMLEKADAGLVVFDGNKGGTHNVFQQLIEKKKPFVWINPVNQKIYEII